MDSPAARAFIRLAASERIVVGDIVLLEALQGASSEDRARSIERWLRSFDIAAMLDDALAVQGAAHYRRLRALGITPRRTPDLIIATWCIAHAVPLLQSDRDFAAMAKPLGLQLVVVT